jgi:hypothetical protein
MIALISDKKHNTSFRPPYGTTVHVWLENENGEVVKEAYGYSWLAAFCCGMRGFSESVTAIGAAIFSNGYTNYG